MASSSPALVVFLCIVASISLHLHRAKAQPVTNDARSLNMSFIPMPNGTMAPLMKGIMWSCPCNRPNEPSCGCGMTGCGCSEMPIVQPPFQCPYEPICGCNFNGCSCNPPPDYGCPPNVEFCEYYQNNFYCQLRAQALANASTVNGGWSEAAEVLE